MVAAVDGSLVIAGGTTWKDGVKLFPDGVHQLQPRAKKWSYTTSLRTGRAYAASGVVNGKLWAIGGNDTNGDLKSFVGIDAALPAINTGDLTEPLVYAAGAASTGGLYVIGGSRSGADLSTGIADVQFFSTTTHKLEKISALPDGPRVLATAVVLGDELFIFGGAVVDKQGATVRNLATCWAMNLASRTWRAIEHLPTPRRGPVAARLDDRFIAVTGGFGKATTIAPADGFLDDLLIYDTVADRFIPTNKAPYAALLPGFVNDGKYLHYLGGEDRQKGRSDAHFRIVVRGLIDAVTTQSRK